MPLLHRTSRLCLALILFSCSLKSGLTDVARQTEVSFLDAAGLALDRRLDFFRGVKSLFHIDAVFDVASDSTLGIRIQLLKSQA